MKHLVTILLILACGYSIKIRHDNFMASRPAVARVHAAKARELKAELGRRHADEYHLKMADECADFITQERDEWVHKTDQYALLSNGLIAITLFQLGTYLKRKRSAEPSGGAYVSPAAGDPSAHP